MDADTVRRMLDQNVLKNHVRLEHPGHGPVRDKLAQSTSNERAHARSAGSHDPTYRKPTVPGIITFAAGVPVRAKTAGQVAYVNAIESHTITFGIGPAGTGKTYLAVAKAVRAFQDKQIRRIILTRPAVEAGESLGFLPGTLNDKVDPYLRPLYDALGDMLGADQLKRYMDDGSIEVAPLAYMRGRTLNDAFVILDEAQNTTEQQMKMFLTRLGFNTTMVITGDISQVDLTVPRSGLATIERILGGHQRHRIRASQNRGRGTSPAGRTDRGRLRPSLRHRRRPPRHRTQGPPQPYRLRCPPASGFNQPKRDRR